MRRVCEKGLDNETTNHSLGGFGIAIVEPFREKVTSVEFRSFPFKAFFAFGLIDHLVQPRQQHRKEEFLHVSLSGAVSRIDCWKERWMCQGRGGGRGVRARENNREISKKL